MCEHTHGVPGRGTFACWLHRPLVCTVSDRCPCPSCVLQLRPPSFVETSVAFLLSLLIWPFLGFLSVCFFLIHPEPTLAWCTQVQDLGGVTFLVSYLISQDVISSPPLRIPVTPKPTVSVTQLP